MSARLLPHERRQIVALGQACRSRPRAARLLGVSLVTYDRAAQRCWMRASTVARIRARLAVFGPRGPRLVLVTA